MSYAKKSILIAISALVCLAALSVGSASATVLCKTHEEGCSEANRYAAGATFNAALKSGTTATIKTLGGTTLDVCNSSTLSGEVTDGGGSYGKAVKIDVSSATFGECTKTTAPEGLPWHSEVNETEPGKGTQAFSNLTINAITIFGTCKYGNATFNVTGGSQAELASQGTLTKVGGNATCPTTVAFTATYVVSEPSPLFVSRATPGTTVLCKAEPQNHVCSQGNIYPLGTEVQTSMSGGTAFYASNTVVMTCSGATLNMRTTGPGWSSGLSAETSALSFSGCTRTFNVLSKGTSEIRSAATNGNGTVTHANDISINTPYGTCTYEFYGPGELIGGASPKVSYTNATMVKTGGGLCWTELTYSAEFPVSSPGPLYVGQE